MTKAGLPLHFVGPDNFFQMIVSIFFLFQGRTLNRINPTSDLLVALDHKYTEKQYCVSIGKKSQRYCNSDLVDQMLSI